MTTDESTLARELRHDGIDVEEVRVADGRVAVVYTTTLPGSEPDHGELGRVCTTFIDLVEAGDLDPVRVEATAMRHPGDVQATWRIEADWLDDIVNYRITEEEFSARVLDSVDTDPDPERTDAAVAEGEEGGGDA
ncbi:hypothetical protein Hbl1158_06315 [Halobaculum sp. CBA1158]|uniref:hypothetical protein n=1 Tax=Halobaculum sp. CBA1158 TaxID=2904243 RepID=UPI001F47C8D9|nr:hypothetical protein [Halobaculum sp. CBA1158]UIP00967.1 hypothetical protein Hbl1158_06315 [Halobaculum sp. CBA1158]